MRLVEDAKHAWKWFSVQLIAVGVALQGASLAFPDMLRQYIPDRVMHLLAIAVLGGAVLGRLIKQENAHD